MLRDMWSKGATAHQIAFVLGFSESAVVSKKYRMDLPNRIPRGEWKRGPSEQLRALWLQGLTTAKIAAALGVGRNAVIGRAHRMNLPARPNPVARRETAVSL